MGSRSVRTSSARSWSGESDLTRILEVSPSRAAALRKVGIRGFEDLSRCDAKVLSKKLSSAGTLLSPIQIERMRCHVRSYREERALRCGPLPELGEEFIALDLEYDIHEPRVWIIGLCAVEGESREHAVFWAENARGEREGLERMADLLNSRPDAPILTWGGIRADFPQLKGACRRLGLKDLLDGFYERHVDLYVKARDGLRLPIPSLALDGVAAFFGTDKVSPIENGLEALNLYRKYCTRYSPRIRDKIREDLIVYNRDDLDALVATARAIEELPPMPEAQRICMGMRPMQESLECG
jgi:predicted RecB family nuclease